MQKDLYWRFGVLIIGLSLLISCHKGADSNRDTGVLADTEVSVQYARNFSVQTLAPGVRRLTIVNPESKRSGSYEYLLVSEGADVPDSLLDGGCTVLNVPLSRIICMTSLQLSNFIALDATDCIGGITSTRHLFDLKMKEQLQSGKTAQIGIEGNFDNEVVIAIDPQLVLISPSKRGGYDTLVESGLPLMPHLGYQESDPLGQAEWIKVAGLLTGKEQQACATFDSIVANYNRVKQIVAEEVRTSAERPSVMSGDMKGGNWYATGGRSFLAQIIKDAGARYFMEDDESTGGVNIDFEMVYAQGADADYWRVSNSFDGDFTYEELGAQDSRFRDFRSFKEHHVIYCNMSQVPFYESFPVHPDSLLMDFVAIFYPNLLPNYKAQYYKLLSADQ